MAAVSVAFRLVEKLPARYQNTAKQFIKFGVTGTIGAIVDFSSYALLTRGFSWTATYHLLGQEISAANNVSVLLAILSNFLFNKRWTFRDTNKNIAGQGASYFVLNIFTWTLNQLLMSFFTYQVPWLEALFGQQKDFVAKALAIGIILFINFFGSKFLIFRKQTAR